MQRDPEGRTWSVRAPVGGPLPTITFRAVTPEGRPGQQTITPAVRPLETPLRRRVGGDAASIGAWPENGVLGTQLEPYIMVANGSQSETAPLMFHYLLDLVTATWLISAIGTAGVIIRPFSWPEAIWAVLAAALLFALDLIGLETVLKGVLKGTDVYLFLIGMMLLAETARREGLFDWLAAVATTRAAGSPQRLFLLIYGVGVVVTVFLSNDATAVVLTPAVAATAR